jgi:glycerol-3-phosphate dehydrogenase (NAD(P)+)
VSTKKVAVLGEGAWGTAFATLLTYNKYQVNVWCYHADIAYEINTYHTNKRYMPQHQLSELLYATHDIQKAIKDIDLIFCAIPVQYLRSVCQLLADYIQPHQICISLSKGIEKDTLLLPTQIVHQVLGAIQTVVISGPSFAADIMQQQPTGLVIATDNKKYSTVISDTIRNHFCMPELSSDMYGIQLCGALKNVIALGVGILDGAGYLDNTKALFITECLQEIGTLVEAAGGQKETVYGIAGIGDIMLSAYSKQGRNREVGWRIGKGESLDTITQETGYTPEGVNTVMSIQQLAETLRIDLPLCQAVHDVIYASKPATYIIKYMMR